MIIAILLLTLSTCLQLTTFVCFGCCFLGEFWKRPVVDSGHRSDNFRMLLLLFGCWDWRLETNWGWVRQWQCLQYIICPIQITCWSVVQLWTLGTKRYGMFLKSFL